MANLEILKSDLRAYILNARDYDGSATAAHSREMCLLAALGSLPWGMGEKFRFNFRMSLELCDKRDVEKAVEKHISLVERELEKRSSPKVF